ncbi:MAG: M60 family metallopeptidase [Culturomica sp.]|jgi:hypothetical protein|nr:M60 family metallopeptidase [Culturomica sp.]
MNFKRIFYKLLVAACLTGMLGACEQDRPVEEPFLPEYDLSVPQLPGFVERLPNPLIFWAQKFPGLVDDSVPRIERQEVVIEGKNRAQQPEMRIGSTVNTPWISTGLYAPPAEVITIIKPSGWTGDIRWQIGSSRDVLDPKKVACQRYPNLRTTGLLTGDSVKVHNLLGGPIYLIAGFFTGTHTFVVKGAVKSPDFVLGQTDPQQWLQEIQVTGVPFAEFATEHCIWSMPTTYLKNVEDPVALAEFYDDVVENDFDAFHGLSEHAPDPRDEAPAFPWRHVQDLQLSVGAAYSGYPAMYAHNGAGVTYAERGVSLSRMKNTDEAWGWYHELGHNYQMPSWKWIAGNGSVDEVVNNLHIFHSRNRLNNGWPQNTDSWYEVVQKWVKRSGKKDFDSNDVPAIGADRARLLMFVQLAQKYGWRLYAYLGKMTRELDKTTYDKVTSEQDYRRNFFCLRVSEYAQRDLRPFFDAWGLRYSEFVGAAIATLPALETSDKFWEQWDPSVIPSFEAKNTAGLTLLPTEVVWQAPPEPELLVTTGWTVQSVCGPPGETGKVPENMINGKEGTGDYWATPTNNWVAGGLARRPILDPQPWVIFDMQTTFEISGINIRLRRNNGYIHLGLKKFTVEVAANPAGPWTSLGTFDNTTFTAGKEYSYTDDPDSAYPVAPAAGRYLRLTLLESFPKTPPNQENGFAFVDRLQVIGLEVK